MTPAVDPRFAAEIARTLRDEIGARALYGRLARHGRDAELSGVLQALVAEGATIEAQVRELARDLGAEGRDWSPTRWVSARLLSLGARLGLRLFALRIGLESEELLARRYAGFADWLARTGRVREARACTELADAKSRRARALSAWVPR